MTTPELEALLAELIATSETAFASKEPNATLVQQIILKLKGIFPQDKSFFKEFVIALKNNLFESGANFQGLDLSSFIEQTTQERPAIQESETIKEKAVDFINELSTLIECIKDDLLTLKNYFFIQLQLDSNLNYTPLILYEAGCFYQLIKKKIQEKYGSCFCLSIEEMKVAIEKNDIPDSNFIAFLIVSTKLNEESKILKRENDLKDIFNHFETTNHLTPKKLCAVNKSDVISTNDNEALLEEIRYVSSSLLTNAELSNEEENVIKKLFKDSNCPLLQYKVLKGGKSGSKVIEIRPMMNYAARLTKRFIVKFGPLDEKKKIAKEARSFGDHIENYSIPKYQKTYVKNSMVEAIKYTYASDNSIRTSYSFSEILTDIENEFYSYKKQILEELFASDPFELWNESIENEKIKISDLYSDFIKPEKFFENVKRIKGIDDSQLRSEDIFNHFNKVFNLEIDVKSKVCHGDLHSENFFKDTDGIYLIDFGFTGKRHAIIDHISLECSLKFKHVPYYIDLNILENIENQLLSEDSFNASFELTSSRKDILEFYDLLKIIRIDSLSYLNDINSRLEYLISLFIITCRHTQYTDLNQLYALRSAEILGTKIVQLLP